MALLLTYGYEIFNFNLSFDEPLYPGAGQRSMAAAFAGQGRWGMAVQYAVLPENIVPTVSTGLGVVLIGASVWVMATRVLDLSWAQAALFASVAATLPALGFAISFATIAVGFGIGFACVSAYAYLARLPLDQNRAILAVLAGALAIGTYQAFAFAILAVALAATALVPRWSTVVVHGGLILGAFVTHLAMSTLARVALPVGEDEFISGVMDLPGLAADPLGRVQAAAERGWGLLAPGGGVFDALQPWLTLVAVALAVLALQSSVRRHTGAPRLMSLAAVVGLVLVPFVAALFVPELPLRSMVYLPYCLLALAAVALRRPDTTSSEAARGRLATGLAAVVGALAVVGNASAANEAFVAADAAVAHDTFIAMRINEELGRLFPEADGPVPTLVSSPDVLASSSLGRAQEQFGLTLFSGVGWRATRFLGTQGVDVKYVDDEQYAEVAPILDSMPSYPQDGWVEAAGDVLLVKLGDDPEMQG